MCIYELPPYIYWLFMVYFDNYFVISALLYFTDQGLSNSMLELKQVVEILYKYFEWSYPFHIIWYNEVIKLLLFRAPPGCLQYFTGVRNTVKSFNWDGTTACSSGCFLREQAYRVCFRPEKGSFFFLIILFLQLNPRIVIDT